MVESAFFVMFDILLVVPWNQQPKRPQQTTKRPWKSGKMGRKLGHAIQCHKMLYHVNKEKDPQILSTWRVLHSFGQCCKFRLRKPMVELAFFVMFDMCVLHLRSSDIWSPKYGFESTCSNMSSQQVSTIRDSTRPHTISLSHKRPTRRSQIISKTLCRWLLVVPWKSGEWAENWGMRFKVSKVFEKSNIAMSICLPLS
jgi:hypothetical protein